MAFGRCCHTIVPMAAEAFVQCRVAPATKAALRAAAERQQLTESALLKRMLDFVLHTTGPTDFILVVRVASMAAYERFTREALVSHDNVVKFTSYVVLDEVKAGLGLAI